VWISHRLGNLIWHTTLVIGIGLNDKRIDGKAFANSKLLNTDVMNTKDPF